MADETYSEVLRNIISEICGIPASEIENSRDLFELGFDSIRVMEMVVRIREELDVEIFVQDLYVSPCVDGLTEVIRDKKTIMK